TAWNLQNLKEILDMAEAVAGGKEALRRNPFIVCYLEPTPPLIHTKEALEKLLFCAENHIPSIYTAASIAGTTGPITLAGSIASSIARCLSGLVISQLKKAGAPVVVSFHTTIFDMKTMIHSYSSPENHLGQLASKAIARYYRLPTFGKSGCSDSKIFDQQAVMEADRWIFVEGVAGDNLNHDVGYLESGMSTSLELIVACEESIASTRRFLRGIDINNQTLALDVIDKVGPQGQFIAEDHTYEYHRKEFWTPILSDRLNYRQWSESGSSNFCDRVRKRLNTILAEHRPQPLVPDVKERLDEILQHSAERENIR
ncbi:MAG: trimethylamine methyltransferase family protein, partial [Deltaproteobacteria bacterium]|nr:trimethylamine methyltransferase family protein [Deltaproteobacteria bacterium]